MAIQSLARSPNWGEQITAAPTGLSEALSSLAQSKIDQIQRQKQMQQNVSGLQALGIQGAENLAGLDPKILQQVIKQKLAEPSQQAFATALGQLLGNESEQSPVQQQSNQAAVSPAQKKQVLKYLGSEEAKKQYTPSQIKQAVKYLNKPAMPEELGEIKKIAPSPKLTEQQALKLAELGLKKGEIDEKRKLSAFKETKKIREAISARSKQAKETVESINRLEELEKEGLPSPGYMEFLKNSGLDIASLAGAPAEEYNKIAANFIRGAKDVYGGRITNQEMEQFLKTVPSLANSPEGRKRINANLKRIANLQKAEAEVYREILKENKGIPPLDLDLQLDEKLEKKREHFYDQFKKDLSKKVPEGESALATTLLSAAGSAIGNIPKAIKGAGLGALGGAAWGARGGPVGALGGGVLGGLAGLAGFNPSIRDIL